jgi:hypothetical protein
MTRYFNIAFILMMVAGIAAVYDRKYETELVTEKSIQLRSDIAAEKETLALLKAEWSVLRQPARLQQIVARYNTHLELAPLTVHQIVTVNDLPERPMDLLPLQRPARPLGGYAGSDGRVIQ